LDEKRADLKQGHTPVKQFENDYNLLAEETPTNSCDVDLLK